MHSLFFKQSQRFVKRNAGLLVADGFIDQIAGPGPRQPKRDACRNASDESNNRPTNTQLRILNYLNSALYIILLAASYEPMITDGTSGFKIPPLAAVESPSLLNLNSNMARYLEFRNASRILASLSFAVVRGDYCALATPRHDCGGVRASGFPPQLNDCSCHHSCVDVARSCCH